MAGQNAQFEEKCKKAIEHYKKELGKLRTGRASASLLEGVHVDYYGSSVPLIQLGMINAPEPRLITVQVYDAGAIESIEKAILQADLGLNPSRDGSLIRISIPTLSEERRKEMVKKLHKMAEEAKVGLRGLRRDDIEAIKKREKDKKISEDDSRREQEGVQKIVDKYVAEIDVATKGKEKEMLEV